jgi:hypothetical protein
MQASKWDPPPPPISGRKNGSAAVCTRHSAACFALLVVASTSPAGCTLWSGDKAPPRPWLCRVGRGAQVMPLVYMCGHEYWMLYSCTAEHTL